MYSRPSIRERLASVNAIRLCINYAPFSMITPHCTNDLWVTVGVTEAHLSCCQLRRYREARVQVGVQHSINSYIRHPKCRLCSKLSPFTSAISDVLTNALTHELTVCTYCLYLLYVLTVCTHYMHLQCVLPHALALHAVTICTSSCTY